MYNSPLFWEHGSFLQPQHFQLDHLQSLKLLAQNMQILNPYLYGVRSLSVNEDALANGILEIVNLEYLLPTGEWLLVPENTELQAKAFQDSWPNQDTPLQVNLGLAPMRDQGGNVTRVVDPSLAQAQYRFLASVNPEVIPDLYGDGPASEVYVMRYNLQICLGETDGENLWQSPLLRLIRDGDRVHVDPHFAPPCVDLNAMPMLRMLVKNVRDSLLSRSKQLGEYKIVAGDIGSTEISSLHGMTLFSVLGVLSRNAPELNNYLLAPNIHPWVVYVALSRLVGELSVYAADLSPLGETMQGVQVMPAYDHNNLYQCFSATCTIILRLIDTLVIGPAFIFTLDTSADSRYLSTVIPQSARGNMYAYWLLLRTTEQEGLANRVQTMGKLVPTKDMRSIIGQALPGIKLFYTEQPPAGLPKRKDTLYFMLDQNDPLWQKALQDGDIAFMLPDRPRDLLCQLTIIQR
ncbi:MAG: type VI secretion system baseplate subunit TssK [Desulfovibrionaceae bacterium]|nr:type VI secretion system baseplate subunit TssK [Desulfovibrionaceae bacterium]